MIWIKIGVKIGNTHPVLWKCIKYVEKTMGDVYITSGDEGLHMPTSFHYLGRALDFSRNNKTKKDIRKAVDEYCQIYGIHKQDFDLIEYDKGNFFHLEYDPK